MQIRSFIFLVVLFAGALWAQAQPAVTILNPGFETLAPGGDFAQDWKFEIGGGAKGRVQMDRAVKHSGQFSVHMENQSPLQAFVFVMFSSRQIDVEPSTTYCVDFYAKTEKASQVHCGISYEGYGDHRLYIPRGTADWKQYSCTFTTPPEATKIVVRFACDDVTQGAWIDDVTLRKSLVQNVNLEPKQYPKDFEGVFPRAKGELTGQLCVFDCTLAGVERETEAALSALQGIVNRENPSLYLIHNSNPAQYDEMWLKYMQDKGYTGPELRVRDVKQLLTRYADKIKGAIVFDPQELPGSRNVAYSLAGVLNALPVTPAVHEALGLPVVMDLRGRWTTNVEAYRFVYENYWDQINHFVISWHHPESLTSCALDYMVAFNIMSVWMSGYPDPIKGSDPPAEEQFIHELLANTPPNIPVMGWGTGPNESGIQEYSWVRLLSEYGKFVPGTEFCSNMSLHSAIHPDPALFKQNFRKDQKPLTLDPSKVYVSANIIDSGDAIWYFQFYQRKIWSDPMRGTVPLGYCLNVTLIETMPLVAQWYYENATENDSFFCAISGLGYMNTQDYLSRYAPEQREAIWSEYMGQTVRLCRALDIDGVEIFNGGWGDRTPPNPQTFQRFVDSFGNLDYILADLGRHDCIEPDNADAMLGETAVFHTLTRYQVWTSAQEAERTDMENCNTYLVKEIIDHTPSARPAFMSAMAISWYYYPSWIMDLKKRLPENYELVRPDQLAALYRQQASKDINEQ